MSAGTTLAEVTVPMTCPECGHDQLNLEVEIDAAAITLYCPVQNCIGELEDQTNEIITPMIIQALAGLSGESADLMADAIITSFERAT